MPWVDPSWSPEGGRLILGILWDWASDRPSALHVVDLRTGAASPLPRSEGHYSPRWSPDGRWIVALSTPATRLALHELGTGRWRGGWIGLAPDDSPIALRAIGSTEIYALDVQWP